jgi:hypothetical protein
MALFIGTYLRIKERKHEKRLLQVIVCGSRFSDYFKGGERYEKCL